MMLDNAWKMPSSFRLGIVMIAFCIFPLGFVYAQDFNAVERKLEESIKAGDLTEEDAALMLNALKRSKRTAGGDKGTARGDKGSDRDLEAKKRRYDSYAKEIEAAVKAGKLSREEADKKLIEVRTKLFRNGGKKPADKGDRRGISVEDYRRGEAQIRELVEKGKVSREDAEKRLIEMRKRVRREKPEGDDRSRKPTERDRR